MTRDAAAGADPTTSPGTVDRLDSWKDVAAYLKRDVSTVQRWERREGLPIHRLQHDKLGSVFAFRHEVDAWREARSRRGEPPIGAPEEAVAPTILEPPAIPVDLSGPAEAPVQVEPSPARRRIRHLPAAGAAAGLMVAGLVLWSLVRPGCRPSVRSWSCPSRTSPATRPRTWSPLA